MSYATINGNAVLDGAITLPLRGVWHAEVQVDVSASTPAVGERATILAGAFSAIGTFAIVGDWQGVTKAIVVGGANGLPTMLSAKGYRSVEARIPVADVLRDCGESLSSTSDQSRLAVVLGHHVRSACSAGTSIERLATAIGCSWRMLLDGTVWIGQETWPQGASGYEVMELREHRKWVMVTIGDQPEVLPGTTIAEGRVAGVIHRIGQKLRSEVFLV